LVREVVDDKVTKPSVVTTRACSIFLKKKRKRKPKKMLRIVSVGKYLM
jgi:hypothetical protein